MKSIEEELKIKKYEIDNTEIPEELEDRLRAALNSIEGQKRKRASKKLWFVRHRIISVVLLAVIFLGVYNYDVFAYYGRKILGYDEITFGSIKELNEAGMGQEINKAYEFRNGTKMSLDGVMLDENKLVVMYTLKGVSQDKISDFNMESIKGTFGNYNPTGGQGKFSDDYKEIRWIQEFEAPSAFDRNLTFSLVYHGDDISKNEMGSITFKLDMNKAIKRVVKCDINQVVEFEGTKYKFTTMSATPLSVVIEGSIETSSEEEREMFSGKDMMGPTRRLHVELVETYLMDGKPVVEKLQGNGSGIGSGTGGIKFQYEFDGLKGNVEKLALNVVKIEDMRIIDKSIAIDTKTKETRVVPETDELIIRSVREEGGNTIVTFKAQEDVAFVTALMIGGEQAKSLGESTKTIEDNGRAYIEKTCSFEGTGEDMKLMFKTLSHETNINEQITIYENK